MARFVCGQIAGHAASVIDCRGLCGHKSGVRERVAHETSRARPLVLLHVEELPTRVVDQLVPLLKASTGPLVLTAMSDAQAPPCSKLLEIAAVEIELPPLRERAEDIPGLVASFIGEANVSVASLRCRGDALAELIACPWPGNVTELRRVINSALASSRGRDIGVEDLPARYRGGRLTPGTIARGEQAAIRAALYRSGWNYETAALELGVSRATLYRKVKRFGLVRPAR